MSKLRDLRVWRRRAETLHRKAELLMSEAIAALGLDDPMTDEVDSILVATADTLSHLDNRITRLKETGK